MRWLYNDTWYDVSRFTKCKLKFLNVCELLSIPEFQNAVDEYQDEFDISDEWIIAQELELRKFFWVGQENASEDEIIRMKKARTVLGNIRRAYKKLGFYIQGFVNGKY